jgi:hypothetical protein
VPNFPRVGVPQSLSGLNPAAIAQAAELTALTSNASKTRLLEAVRFAHGLWRQQARFQNIFINSVSAVGVPGCLDGPALGPLIKMAPGVAGEQGNARALLDAVAQGVSTCFAAWQHGVSVPGLPWYPTFAAVPAPAAPPTANVPTPLVVCHSPQAGMLGHQMLKGQIMAALPAALRMTQLETCVGAMAQSLATYFATWIAMQQVVGVLGHGPVPSFAPPAVPLGPVVGGSVIPTPGHLALGPQPAMAVV